jgi:hypothetical protein
VTDRAKITSVLIAFSALFVSLTVTSYVQKSATADEPIHLAAGYTKLKLRDYRVHLENPPLLQMWAALPLLAMKDARLDTNTVYWSPGGLRYFAHQFLYKQNDADRLLYRARFMIVLLGLLLGVLVFCWSRELFGFWTATIVLGLYTLEPNLLAHSSLVTTDLGVTCFIFGAVYFAWRTLRRFTVSNVTGLTVCFALAHVSKFSGIVVWPVIVFLLIRQQPRRAFGIITMLFVVTWATIWAAYAFRFSITPDGQLLVVSESGTPNWIETNHLLPNAYVEGFLKLGRTWPGYLFGRISDQGWWYYFPVAFLTKTPIAHLLLFVAGAAWCIARRQYWLFLPILFIFGPAMLAKLNLGLRHVLPAYPFVLLIAGFAVHELLRRQRLLLLGLGLLAVAQIAFVYPNYLAFSNWVGRRPCLLDSNLDWGQDLKPLKRWMDAHRVEHINLSYFGSADPAYYGINCTYLLGSPAFAAASEPKLPGYAAVSLNNLYGVALPEPARNYYRALRARKPVAIIGHSIHVYWIEKYWWPE